MKTFVVLGKKFSGAQSILKGPSSDYTALHKFTVGALESRPDCDVVELCECMPKKTIKMKSDQKPIALDPKPFIDENPAEKEPEKTEPEKPKKTKSPNRF